MKTNAKNGHSSTGTQTRVSRSLEQQPSFAAATIPTGEADPLDLALETAILQRLEGGLPESLESLTRNMKPYPSGQVAAAVRRLVHGDFCDLLSIGGRVYVRIQPVEGWDSVKGGQER